MNEPAAGLQPDLQIAPALLAWFDRHGRHDLPWQHPRSPYRVWLAEIMLQQTQVATAIGYYQRFLQRFADLQQLALADEDEVLALWSGLGYYARARNLHRAARICLAQHDGRLPEDLQQLQALPGIGRSTAGAILAQAHGKRQPILDGNVRRVLARLLALETPVERAAGQRMLWDWAERLTPHQRVADYTQAIMDLGASVCTPRNPRCADCPLSDRCRAHALNAVGTYPRRERRPAKRPLRRVRWQLLRRRDGAVWMLQRQRIGLWGGLWTLPESPDEGPASGTQLGILVHDFTHFRLHARVFEDSMDGDLVAESGRWVHAAEHDSLGLPQPVRALLDGRARLLTESPENLDP